MSEQFGYFNSLGTSKFDYLHEYVMETVILKFGGVAVDICAYL